MDAMRTWWHAAGVLMVLALLVGAGCKKEEPAPAKPPGGDTRETKVQEVADAAKDVAEKAGEAVDAAADKAAETAKDAIEKAEDALEKAGDAVESAAEAIVGAVTEAKKELTEEDKAKILANLARADALDGAEDKVVSKCAACKLSVDGNDENTIVVEGYTMKFCSVECQRAFDKDPEKAVLAMEFPEEPPTE